MNTVEKATVYFKRAGTENTLTLLETVKKYIETEEIKDIVVASITRALNSTPYLEQAHQQNIKTCPTKTRRDHNFSFTSQCARIMI